MRHYVYVIVLFLFTVVGLHTPTSIKNKIAVFLACKLDCNTGALEVAGEAINAEPMVQQFLLLLIQNQGEILSKKTVTQSLWQGKEPTDEALRALVKKTREAIKDNARKPIYIKTIPTKGYLLLPTVEFSSSVVKPRRNKLFVFCLLLFICLLVAVASSFWYETWQQREASNINEVTLKKRDIGNVYGENFSTFYINGELKNISLGSLGTNDVSHIKIDDVELHKQQKLIFEQSLFPQFWWSNGSQRGLVMRNDRKGFFTLQFNRNKREPFITEQLVEIPTDTNILGFDFGGRFLYVRSSSKNSFSLLQLATGKYETTPFTNSIQDWLKELLKPNEDLLLSENDSKDIDEQDIDGQDIDEEEIDKQEIDEKNIKSGEDARLSKLVVYFWPSVQNEQIMVGVYVNNDTHFALYANHDSHQYLHSFKIPGQVNSALWSQLGERFSFTDTNANLYSWHAEQALLTAWNTRGETVNRIVADCGASCFVVANTQNLPKLSEIYNPFIAIDSKIGSTVAEKKPPYAQVIFTNTIARNESLPVYSNQGVYFVSEHQDSTSIMYADSQANESLIYQFKQSVLVEELTIDANKNFLAGIANSRPFVVDLRKTEFVYVPITMPFISHVSFNQSGNLHFYASAREHVLNNENADSTIAGMRPSGLYEYNLYTSDISFVKADIKVLSPLLLTSVVDELETRHRGLLEINSKDELKFVFDQHKTPESLTNTKMGCTNCWHISGNYLYQLSINQYSDSFLIRTHLLNGEQQQQVINFDTLLPEFALNPSTQKLMLTTRQSLQTKLAEIKGLKQIY